MSERRTQFSFGSEVPMDEVQGTLRLAQIAAGSLHGAGRVELEAGCALDSVRRTIEIDCSTTVGKTLAMVFLGYARAEFGGAVRVRVDRQMAGVA